MLSTPDLFAFQASNYLSPEGLLRSEVEESQRKLHVAVDTLSFFKQVFQDRREHLRTYFKENQEVREWDFQSSLVFERLDGFLGRLLKVQVGVLVHSQALTLMLTLTGGSNSRRRRAGRDRQAGGGPRKDRHRIRECHGSGEGGIKLHSKREMGVLTGSRKGGSLTPRGSEKVQNSRGNTFQN